MSVFTEKSLKMLMENYYINTYKIKTLKSNSMFTNNTSKTTCHEYYNINLHFESVHYYWKCNRKTKHRIQQQQQLSNTTSCSHLLEFPLTGDWSIILSYKNDTSIGWQIKGEERNRSHVQLSLLTANAYYFAKCVLSGLSKKTCV